MNHTTQVSLRQLDEKDLELIRAWRNHPDIRRVMYTQHEISSQEHVSWFKAASTNSSRHLLIFEIDAQPLGFVNILELENSNVANWGFYTSPIAPKGTGRKIGKAAISYAFDTRKLRKLCGQVLASNERSIRLHTNLGFQCEDILRQHHFDGHKYHDVICFCLEASQHQHMN